MSTMRIMNVVVLLLGGWRMFVTDASAEHLRCSADITTNDEFIANKNVMLEAMHVSAAGILHNRFGSIQQLGNRLRTISYGPVQQYLGGRYGAVTAINYRFSQSQHLGPYGKSWCNLSYTDKECFKCLGIAVDAIKKGCGNALRVEYNVTYCGVRYADHPF